MERTMRIRKGFSLTPAFCLLAFFLLGTRAYAQYQTVTIAVGSGPVALAINQATHTLYVANEGSNSVSVIDTNPASPTFNTIIAGPIAVGTAPTAIAVNAITNRIYVANRNSGNVSIIDGASNTVVATVAVNMAPTLIPFHPAALAVNTNSNQIYVGNLDCGFAAIDARNNSVHHPNFPGLCGPVALAVNLTTNRIHVVEKDDSDIEMYDEVLGTDNKYRNTVLASFNSQQPVAVGIDTNSETIYAADLLGFVDVIDEVRKIEKARVALSSRPYSLATNPATGKAYVLHQSGTGGPATVSIFAGTAISGNLTVGPSLLPVRIPAPTKVLVDSSANKIYVANDGADNVTVIDGNTDSILFSFPTGTAPFAMALDDPTGNVYVANVGSGTVTALVPVSVGTDFVSRTSLTFGSQTVGMSSESQVVTVMNRGRTDLLINRVFADGDFSETDNCLTVTPPIPPGGTCTIYVTFTPTATGTRTGQLTIADTDPSSPQIVSLSGVGTPPGMRVSPSSLTFGSQVINTGSGQQAVTVTNMGTAPLVFINTSTVVTGDFQGGDNCTPSAPPPAAVQIPPGAACTIDVNFFPQGGGGRSGQLTITEYSSGSGVDYIVPLFGNGTSTQGVRLLASSMTFGSQVVGRTSVGQVVTLTNRGFTDLVASHLVVSGEFAIGSETCTPRRIIPGTSCQILVTFTPRAMGTRSGQITITDNQNYSPHFVSLSGTGTSSSVTLTPSSLSFGTQDGGAFGPARSVTVTNTGTNVLNISSITAIGDSIYNESDTCLPVPPATSNPIQPGSSCTIQVAYQTNSFGFTTAGQLVIVDDDSSSPHFVALTGAGTGLDFTVSPSFLSSSGTVNVADGYFQALLSKVEAIGDFTETDNCSPSLTTCTINVTYSPVGGTRIGQIIIDDANHPEISPAIVALAVP